MNFRQASPVLIDSSPGKDTIISPVSRFSQLRQEPKTKREEFIVPPPRDPGYPMLHQDPATLPDRTPPPPPRARPLRPDILDVKKGLVTHPAIKPEIMRRLSEHRFEGVTLSFPTLPDPKHALFPILHLREAIYQNPTRKIINRNRGFFLSTNIKPELIFLLNRKNSRM